MKNPLISIVIPSYNKSKFIDKTLASIVNQNYDNYEVFVQDGGSNDGSVQVIKKYVKKYPNKFFLSTGEDGGQLNAINKGMEQTKGDIVTFINADDYYGPNAFSLVAEKYRSSSKSSWYVGFGSIVDHNNQEIAHLVSLYKKLLLIINSRVLLLVTNYLMQPSVFLSKEYYQKYGPFSGNSSFVTEYDLWLKIAMVKMPIIIHKNISFFRIEPNTKTMTMGSRLLAEDEKIVKRYTTNKLILFLHKLHNIARLVVEKVV